MLNAERLSLMKPDAILINAARGWLVDEAAVKDMLKTERLAGAAEAFAEARDLMAEFSVPVVVEVILERVTNIAMGTEIDNINEFEPIEDLEDTVDADSAILVEETTA